MNARPLNYLLMILITITILILSGCGNSDEKASAELAPNSAEVIQLPEPRYDSEVSLEESLLNRRSIRNFSNEPVTLQELSQLLWATQGITDSSGHRTAPSAVALYPLIIYVVVGNVPEIVNGVYVYEPQNHSMRCLIDGDARDALATAAMGQASIRHGAISFVVTVDYGKMTARFADKGERFGTLEAGHAAQNLSLQATALDLGLVTAGAIYDDQVAAVLNLPEKLTPVYVIPVGRKLE